MAPLLSLSKGGWRKSRQAKLPGLLGQSLPGHSHSHHPLSRVLSEGQAFSEEGKLRPTVRASPWGPVPPLCPFLPGMLSASLKSGEGRDARNGALGLTSSSLSHLPYMGA